MDKRPIESILPSEIMEKAREYAKTIEHSYADTREELEEDVALAWAKGFIFCLQGKVKAICKDKEEAIQKLTDGNKKLKVDVAYYTQKLERVLDEIKENEYVKVKPIPIWKWVLLFFCPVHIGYDEEGDIACVTFAKILFKHIYIVREDYFCKATGNLLRIRKLTRKG